MAHFSLLSETHTTKSSTDSLFDFMGDFNNFKHLLPEDKIDNFECTTEQCSFNIKGLTSLTIKIKEKHPKSKITFGRRYESIYKSDGRKTIKGFN
jgi:hypothetical protein